MQFQFQIQCSNSNSNLDSNSNSNSKSISNSISNSDLSSSSNSSWTSNSVLNSYSNSNSWFRMRLIDHHRYVQFLFFRKRLDQSYPFPTTNMGIHSSHVLRIAWISISHKIFKRPWTLECLCFPMHFPYYVNSLFPWFRNCIDAKINENILFLILFPLKCLWETFH